MINALKILLHKRNTFTIKKQNLFIFIIVFYYIFSLNHIINGGIFYDDWSLTVGFLSDLTFEDKFKDLVLKTFLTRPVGGIYLTILTELGKNDYLYIFINSSFWLISSYIIVNSFDCVFSENSKKLIFLTLLFPSFASTMIFSPVTQTLGVMSIFFWSLSLFFSKKNKYFLSIIFFVISVLTYELSIVLLLFNIFLLIENNSTKNVLKNFVKTSLIFLIITFGIIIFQFLITKIMGYTGSLKYAFFIENNKIIFEEDFFINVKKYFFKPIILIFYDIPNLFFRSIFFFKINIFSIFFPIIFLVLIILKTQDNSNIISSKGKLYLLSFCICLSVIGVFLVYLVVSSVPQVNGYYNRGLVGLFICFALFIGLIFETKIKNLNNNFIKNSFIVIIVFFNFLSFQVQQQNHITANKVRDTILLKFSNFSKKNDEMLVLTFIPTYIDNNYNDEVIFSEEVEDLFFAVRYKTNKKVIAGRIYNDKQCKKVLEIEDNSISGFVTSKNRKYRDKTKHVFYKFSNKNRDIYLFKENEFIKLSYENNANFKILSKHLGCKI